MLYIYLDNDVASSISKNDLDPTQQVSLDKLLRAYERGCVEMRVSRHSDREMERAPSEYQLILKRGIQDLSRVPNDHKVLGYFKLTDPYGGFISNPIVTDIPNLPLFENLLSTGLRKDDAQHLLYAVMNGMEFFVTCDKGILSKKTQIEGILVSASCHMAIRTPYELYAELGI